MLESALIRVISPAVRLDGKSQVLDHNVELADRPALSIDDRCVDLPPAQTGPRTALDK
jgi:hypothetical protein